METLEVLLGPITQNERILMEQLISDAAAKYRIKVEFKRNLI
jgi:hypothetical protein